jgi:hypothetical protein
MTVDENESGNGRIGKDGSTLSVTTQPPATSPLHAALQMGDLVRSRLNQVTTATNTTDQDKADFRLTPGLLEGIGTGIAAMLLLTPVRSILLKAAGSKFGVFPDLVCTTSQIMVSANAALYYGSLYGSYHYLQTFNTIPVNAVSPTVDDICQVSSLRFDTWYQQQEAILKMNQSSSPSSWDPSALVLTEFSKAMKLCHKRRGGD